MTVLPLESIRVINFGVVAVSSTTAQYLCNYGAEVIKVETMKRLDMLRSLIPLVPSLPYEEMINNSGTFTEYTKGVKSVQANLKNPEAIDLVKKLVSVSDVVIENYSPGVMKKMGLGYEDLKKIKPDIIMVSLSGLGQTGPLSDLVTWGPVISSLTGGQNMLGYPDGEPSMDYASADFIAAGQAAFLILSALYYRKRTGKGQYIDLGQTEPTIYIMGEPIMDYVMNKRVAKMEGNQRQGFVPHNAYRCKRDETHPIPEEQWITIAVKTEEEWRNLCKVMGDPAWTKDDKFSNRDKRWNNQEALDKFITEWTVKYSSYELVSMLQSAGVAAMVCADMRMRTFDPQFKSREAYRPIDIGNAKGILYQKPALNLSKSSYVWAPSPKIGEHNDYVYGELCGIAKEEIERLKKIEAII